MEFSDYIIYVDESGDHVFRAGYEEYPVFVLAFCIFKKSDYFQTTLPAIHSLKFDFWGHDSIILHSNKIRKQKEDFSFLTDLVKMEKFMGRVNNLMDISPFTIIATVIDKQRFSKNSTSHNLYNLGLLSCLTRASQFLEKKGQKNKLTHILIEARNPAENAKLKHEFKRILTKSTLRKIRFEMKFIDKQVNIPGLQIADLVAHPLGKYYLHPDRKNRSYEILANKFYGYPKHDGKGVKIFPRKQRRKNIEILKV